MVVEELVCAVTIPTVVVVIVEDDVVVVDDDADDDAAVVIDDVGLTANVGDIVDGSCDVSVSIVGDAAVVVVNDEILDAVVVNCVAAVIDAGARTVVVADDVVLLPVAVVEVSDAVRVNKTMSNVAAPHTKDIQRLVRLFT